MHETDATGSHDCIYMSVWNENGNKKCPDNLYLGGNFTGDSFYGLSGNKTTVIHNLVTQRGEALPVPVLSKFITEYDGTGQRQKWVLLCPARNSDFFYLFMSVSYASSICVAFP